MVSGLGSEESEHAEARTLDVAASAADFSRGADACFFFFCFSRFRRLFTAEGDCESGFFSGCPAWALAEALARSWARCCLACQWYEGKCEISASLPGS